MGKLGRYRDTERLCFANIELERGEPCFISLTKAMGLPKGLLVKRSKSGFLGKTLVKIDDPLLVDALVDRLHQSGVSSVVAEHEDITTYALAVVANAAIRATDSSHLMEMFSAAQQPLPG